MNHSLLRFGKKLEDLGIGNIRSLIENRIDESQNLEYKEPSEKLQEDCNDVARTICSFLNTDGGIFIYGVSEEEKNGHRYPVDIKWCCISKERFENLLLNKVQPWEEKIKIWRIKNEKDENEGIFVLEVPKSENPPHMLFDFRYYHRLSFQTQPMAHQNVFRTFQTSWIRRREFHKSVLEPLYSEIKGNCDRISKYEQGSSVIYERVIQNRRYLYDCIEPSLQEKIDQFYAKMTGTSSKLNWKDRIATQITNEELCKVFPEKRGQIKKDIHESLLKVDVKMRYPDGSIPSVRHSLERSLFPEWDLEKYFRNCYSNAELIGWEPVLVISGESDVKILISTFKQLWDNCVSKASENEVYKSLRNDTPKLVKMGNEILELISSK